jgi:mannose-6-phosphate isomerase-like protein (cupin superfamily)
MSTITTTTKTKPGFQIFRAKDAPGLMEAGCMSIVPPSAKELAQMAKVGGLGDLEGDNVRVLVRIPGFSLAHVWFKKEFPLPLHSHDVDCLYYIIAGSLKLGTEELGSEDSFFVPADVPYTYKVGSDGVQLLEIRHENAFNYVNHAKGEAFWSKAAQIADTNREAWKTAKPPALNA